MAGENSVAPKERVNIRYKPATGDAQERLELPLKLIMMGDYILRPDSRLLEDRKPIIIDKSNFNDVMRSQNLSLTMSAENHLSEKPDEQMSVKLDFRSIDNFKPESVVSQVPELSKLMELRSTLQARKEHPGNDMIAEIDKKLSSQVDAIIHHENFQKMESAWRGLKMVVDRADFRENTKLEMLNVSKEDLLNDFEDSPEVVKSGLYKTIYSAQYCTFRGQPYAAMIANYDFGPGQQDVKLLKYVSSVAAMAHCPFIASAGPQFFGLDDFRKLPNLKDLSSVFDGPQYIKWNSFRESEDARYVGLTMPRFLMRLFYDPEANRAFEYKETVSDRHESCLWGNTAFAFAIRLMESFAESHWCPNIIGQQNGTVKDLPVHIFESLDSDTRIPTEIAITDRRELELADQGFISLVYLKGSSNAAFFSANSVQKPKTNYKLNTQLPYTFVITRLAHYIKMIHREQLSGSKQRADIERELNEWISQYVSDQDNPASAIRQRRPLQRAQITVEDVEGETEWYRVYMKVVPHMKYMGASFELSLVGKLDK